MNNGSNLGTSDVKGREEGRGGKTVLKMFLNLAMIDE